MDKITKSFVVDFLNINELDSKGDDLDFEKFSNYTIVYNNYHASFDIDSVSTGDSAQGIDGIAIIVNGKLITDKDEVSDLVELNKFIEVEFVIIQSKTSSSFSSKEIGNFLFSIKNFFSDNPAILTTPEITNQHEISQEIFNYFPQMTKGKPTLKIFYVTTGSFNNEKTINAVIQNGKSELQSLNYFNKIEFYPISATDIQDLYRKTKDLSKANFIFKEKVTLSEIRGVSEAYFGILPFVEFKDVIINENGTIKNIFYDNVRDYLGNNPVNDSINGTLGEKKFDLFTVLNNGVTIVSSNLQTAGNKFTITDYQIVNGCQTSHVLFENKDRDGINSLNIPLRLIVTQDEDVKNEITVATNNQTAIKPEQLEALSQFQKGLEEYYKTFDVPTKLYYERRTNQYSTNNTIYKTKIVSIPQQIKTFAAMFLDLPHIVSGYYGTIMKNHGDRIFVRGHKFFPYYLSSFAFYKLDSFFRQGVFEKKYRKAKYHIIMLYKDLSINSKLPHLNSKRLDRVCEKIYNTLIDDEKAKDIFRKCIKKIDDSGLDADDKYVFKQSDSTRRLK
ncbi:AIPR family protein [Abyssalbus ytuae]|uniref:AIPR family protein n=1 Tax=Abyssalbus ytuae TaxID=2926907 RepID=A0A9E6ZPN1_9FLAO|nr:AIPR family protein [Abyssalbus ytuae]UOB16458.1 AIPR family protein [Abyssalbus ytuae]